jgi:ACS family hexuronate transporter-like MFS transporter
LATGIFNAGTNVGAIVTPLVVPWIVLNYGWRMSFIATGAIGFLWLVAWLAIYRPPEEQPRLSARELAHIRSDPVESTIPVPWVSLLGCRQTWAFAIGKFLTDPIWWFYLYWLPKFLDIRFGIKLQGLALPLIAIYVVADFGSVGGGWLSGFFMRHGWTTYRARKVTMLLAALAIVPTMFAPRVAGLWEAVAIVSVAAAAHQWWSANLFTIATDMFPRRALGSVIGIGGFCGAIGGFLFQRATGLVLQANGNDYVPIFIVCGLAYVTALALIHVIVPRLEPQRSKASPTAT